MGTSLPAVVWNLLISPARSRVSIASQFSRFMKLA